MGPRNSGRGLSDLLVPSSALDVSDWSVSSGSDVAAMRCSSGTLVGML